MSPGGALRSANETLTTKVTGKIRRGECFVGELLQFLLIASTSIFVLVDPFAAIPTFLVMTSDSPENTAAAWPGAPP